MHGYGFGVHCWNHYGIPAGNRITEHVLQVDLYAIHRVLLQKVIVSEVEACIAICKHIQIVPKNYSRQSECIKLYLKPADK